MLGNAEVSLRVTQSLPVPLPSPESDKPSIPRKCVVTLSYLLRLQSGFFSSGSSIKILCVGPILTFPCELHALCRFGDVVVSALAIGPDVRGFDPGQGDGFLRAIKIRSTPYFGWEVKPEVPRRKILRYVRDLFKTHGDECRVAQK
jgi:hypothetical protein